MIKKLFKNQSGFTLIELVIALILLGIVLSLAYTFFSFGISAFTQGEQRSIVQQSSRLTSRFIQNEIRYAMEIIIGPEGGVVEDNYRYIFLDHGTNSIMFRDEHGNYSTLADSQADGVPYTLFFNSNEPENVVIWEIDAGNGLYTLGSRKMADNLELYSQYNIQKYGVMILVNEDGDQSILKYKLPDGD